LKRILAILVAICYLIPAIGISVNKHYCGGKLASIHIGIDHKDNCPCGQKPMKKGCCKNETKFIKFKQPTNCLPHVDLKLDNAKFCILPETAIVVQKVLLVDQYNKVQYHPPPITHKVPIFLLDRVLLIWFFENLMFAVVFITYGYSCLRIVHVNELF